MTKPEKKIDKDYAKDRNLDPISKAPGSHPVGTGVGAAAGGATGAAVGSVAGPVGTVAGAAVGAVVGGLAGKGVAEGVNPTVEEAYWREQYRHEPYFDKDRSYEDYGPAYRTGYEGRASHPGKRFEEVEPDLERRYGETRGPSRLDWQQARPASRAAWDRADRSVAQVGKGDTPK